MRSFSTRPARADYSALALFPLPQTVLFPGALLPLHVFEPRYRRLVADALKKDRLLAVPRLKPGFEADYYGKPAVYEICGAGRIVEHAQLEDGRCNILVAGLARVRLLDELGSSPYRVARAEPIEEREAEEPGAVAALRGQLLSLVQTLRPYLSGDSYGLEDVLREADTGSACADAVAAAIISDPDMRQGLLEELDPVERMVRVLRQLRDLVDELTDTTARDPSQLN